MSHINLTDVHAEPSDTPDPDAADCPHGDPFHLHGDGCPSCDTSQCATCGCVHSETECPVCAERRRLAAFLEETGLTAEEYAAHCEDYRETTRIPS